MAQTSAKTVTRENLGSEPPVEKPAQKPLGLREIRSSAKIRSYIEKANEQMAAIGFTEHGVRHAALVAAIARNTLNDLGHNARLAELAAVAGYLHDIGNV